MGTSKKVDAYQSLFDKSRFFGRMDEARAFDRGFAAEFLGAAERELRLRARQRGERQIA